jgi:hypothetical protein
MPGCVPHVQIDPAIWTLSPSAMVLTSVRLLPPIPPELLDEHRLQIGREEVDRVLEPVAVVTMDEGGQVCRAGVAAYGRHGEDVVQMAVGEQDRGRPQAVLGEDRPEGVDDPDARVDDEAFLSGCGRDDIAIGREGGSGERRA